MSTAQAFQDEPPARPEDDWIEPEEVEEGDDGEFAIDEYDLTSTPNDFNVKTIVHFIEQGVFEIPQFQRHYVWDLKRASKLIESIVLGLPIPQIFLYEQERNRFLVIDGQQRLMSIYYFVSMRFPNQERRGALRRAVEGRGRVPPKLLADDAYFSKFNLNLPARLPGGQNRLHGLNYETLGEPQKTTFDLRTIRCVVVKQNRPQDDDSSVYEIFNRLNTGGVNLTPQEIRTSLYHSPFYELLYRLNADPRWRRILGEEEPDLRMRDVEVLLRGFAMLLRGDSYRPSMTRFLNQFSKEMKATALTELDRLEVLFGSFLDACVQLDPGVFGTRARKLNISIFEAVFAAVAGAAYAHRDSVDPIAAARIGALKTDPVFIQAASTKSTNKAKVDIRLLRARELLARA